MTDLPSSDLGTIHRQLRESAMLYHVLAEQAREPDLRSLFERIVNSRAEMVQALTHEWAVDGVQLPQSASIGGIVDRIWLRVRDSLKHMDPVAQLQECLHAEEHLLEHYKEILADDNASTRMGRILSGQLAVLEGNVEAIRRLSLG